MATPFKFDLPAECRSFTPFPRLPIEIRHKIWESYLSDAGVNFLKLQFCHRGWKSERVPLRPIALGPVSISAQEPPDHDAGAVGLTVIQKDFNPRPLLYAKLVALNPHWKADASHYEVLYRQLAILSMTCVESANLVKSLVSRAGVLRMENGNIVTLENSPDLVFLDYLPSDILQFNFSFDIRLFCPGLQLVRRVAVRFNNSWKSATFPQCSCVSFKNHARTRNYPVHLYQFLARCLPSLEEFYLVDYYIVPSAKSKGQYFARRRNGPRASQTQVFRAKDRHLCEVIEGEASASEWDADAQVFEIRDWLRDCFVRYARASHTSRHKTPERVHFGVLACDWDVAPPVSRFRSSCKLLAKPAPTKITPGGTKLYIGHRPTRFEPGMIQSQSFMFTIHKHRHSLHGSDSSDELPTLALEKRVAGKETRKLGHGSVFEFGAGRGNAFEFTFTQAYGSLGRWAGL